MKGGVRLYHYTTTYHKKMTLMKGGVELYTT